MPILGQNAGFQFNQSRQLQSTCASTVMTWKDSYYSLGGYTTWSISIGQGYYYIYLHNATYDQTLCNHPVPRLTL